MCTYRECAYNRDNAIITIREYVQKRKIGLSQLLGSQIVSLDPSSVCVRSSLRSLGRTDTFVLFVIVLSLFGFGFEIAHICNQRVE